MLVIHELKARYRSSNFTVEAKALEFPRDKVAVLVGDNASGKTTFFKALAGDRELEVDPFSVTAGAQFTYVNQNAERSLFNELSAHQAFFSLSGWASTRSWSLRRLPSFRAMAATLPRDVQGEVLSWKDKLVMELSGGQRAILAVAGAAVRAPDKVLVLDEPAAGLDQIRRKRLATFLRDIAARRPWPILVSSHQKDFTDEFGGALLRASAGKITAVERGKR